MGDAIITRRGGGISKAFALIHVTYPTGSTCTCTNGSKTLRAKDTSGSFLFMIPEAGTWTVSCTNGIKTATTNVIISNKYQTEKIALTYELVLFDNGTLASGYTVTAGIIDGENLHISSNGNTQTSHIDPAIDISRFSTIKIYGYDRPIDHDSNRAGIYVNKTGGWLEYTASVEMPRNTPDWREVDISQVSGLYFFKYSCYDSHLLLSKIIFE